MTLPVPQSLLEFSLRLTKKATLPLVGINHKAVTSQLIAVLLIYALSWQLVPRVAVAARTTIAKIATASEQVAENKATNSGGFSQAAAIGISAAGDPRLATITDAVVSRHKPILNSGRIEGSLRVLLGESFTISGASQITSDLYLPGTPTIQLSGNAQYAGTISDGGATTPMNYAISLSGSIDLPGYIHTNVDPLQLPADFPVSIPDVGGTRTVSVHSQSDIAGVGSWQTVRDLSVNGNGLTINIPPGNYGTFTVNGNNRLNFTAGTYNFANNFNLDGSASIQATGLVVINVAKSLTVTSGALVLGSYTSPGDVRLNVLGSSVNVNGSSQICGLLRGDNATVTVSGTAQVRGQVIANSFTLNGGKVIGSVWPAHSGSSITTFGPRRFDRTTGPPNQYLEQFSLPANATSPYTLHIQNGSLDGTNRVSSATVKLNGAVILSASDLNQNIAGVDRTVTLVSANTLEVSLASVPGSYLVIDIAGLFPPGDTTPPIVAFTSPANNSTTTDSQTTVSGTASDPGPGASGVAHVYVNAEEATYFPSDNTWTIAGTALSIGTNSIVAQVVDQAGNQTAASITVTRENPNQPPVVNAGADQTLALPQTAVLHGTATDDGLPQGSTLLTNWSLIGGPGTVTFLDANALDTSASFSSPGTYVLRLTAEESALSNTDDLTITVQPQNQPPTVVAGPDQTITLPHAATLNGSAADDGLPDASILAISWNQVSGPGITTFAESYLANTLATFSEPGIYVLKLSASDSELSSASELTVTVQPENHAPTVSAGPDQIVVLPSYALLDGSAADDGWPAGSSLTETWSVVSGPAAVNLTDPGVTVTAAAFGMAGTYVLRLTATDGELSSSDEVIITVDPQNQHPAVNAGADQTITLPNQLNLQAAVSDDGWPRNSSVTLSWSQVGGPGTATIAFPSAATTAVSFSLAGIYVLRLTATDSQLSSSDDVQVIVIPENHPPSVNAGVDQTITLPSTANLNGSVNDDGLPSGTLALLWSKVSGPGAVTFGNANQASTTAIVCQPGIYVLRLTANDGELSRSSQVTVTVKSHNTITLTSGNGAVGDRDSADQFTSDGGNTFQDAYVVAPQFVAVGSPFNYSLIPGTQYISNNASASSPQQTTIRYRTQFVLPADYSNSSLSVSVHADNVATVYLNGIRIGLQPFAEIVANFTDPAEIFSTNNPSFFHAGVNTLDFDIHNFFGPGGLDYQAVVSYDGSTLGPDVLLLDNFDSENCGTGVSNYNGLAHWNVTAGSLNLIGNGYLDVQPGHGLYLNLVGSTNQAATLETSETFTLDPGCYTLSFEIGNSLPGNVHTVSVSLGNVYSQQFTRSGNQPLARITRHIKVPVAASATLKFALLGGDGHGLLLDNIYLIKDEGLCSTDNAAPLVNAGTDQTITLPTNSLTLNGSATDDGLPAGSTLSIFWTTVSGPAAVVFGNANSPATTAHFFATGTYSVRLTASDGELTTSDDVSITVMPAPAVNQPPTANAGPDKTVLLSQDAQLNGSASDDGLPAGSHLTTTWAKISGPGTVTFLNPNVTITGAKFGATGTYVLRLTASDGQLTANDDITITVIANVAPPTVEITAPTDGSSVTETALVTGSVSGGAWVLEYSLDSDDNVNNRVWTTFASGNGTISNGQLGTLDPTMLLNGLFDIRLSATDSYGQTSRTWIAVVVERNLKVGNFTVSFSDLNIPVAGVPMEVTRTYDTRDKRVGDFGFGWTLGLKNIRLEKARVIGFKWFETVTNEVIPNYCLQATGSHLVTVTFPSGKVFKFEASVSPQCQRFTPITTGTLTFTPLPGTHGTLEVVGSADFQIDGSVPGPLNLIGFGGGVDIFNSSLFKFTAEDGTSFVIDQRAGLQSIKDTNNNTVTVSAGGIVHSGGKSITFNRDTLGRITRVIDPAGNAQTYTYDAAGDLVSYTDNENNTSTYTYDANHRLLTIHDPRGIQPIRNDYDADGRLISHTDGFGKVITYLHDLPARTETITDRLGHSTTFEYDERGNVLSKTDARGGVTTFTYDANDNVLAETNALGKTTTYVYDANDRRTSITDPLGNVTQFTYNALGRVLTVTDPLGHITTNTYNSAGNLLTTKDALNNTTSFGYSVFDGQRTSMTDALNNITSYTYTGGYLTKETDALGHETTFTYNANGSRASQTVRRTNAQGQLEAITTSYEYDKLNRLKKTTFADGSFTQVEYNTIGQQAATIDQLGLRTEFTYDDMGRLTRTIYADGASEETKYDAEGHRLTSKDRAGHVTSFTYDELGRLTKTTFADGTFTQTTYDAAGQLLTTTDARGNVTHYFYDAAGRRTKVRNALSQETSFTYDAGGNQLSMNDALNHATHYEYDLNNRRTRTTYADSSFATVGYDALGRIVSKTDQAGKTTQFTYDAPGRLTKVKDALSQETVYAYDEMGRQISQTDANNHTTRFEYDQVGRRVKRILPAGQFETYSYDSSGNLLSRTDFNGNTTAFTYDLMRRLLTKAPDASLNQRTIRFSYNATGQRSTMNDAEGTTTYTYDVRNRISSKQTPFGTLSYTYNEAGSLSSTRSSNANGISVDYSYDTLNRLEAVKDNNLLALNGGVTNYTYDSVGNLQGYSYPNGVTSSYVYNALNRLTGMTVGTTGSSLAGYSYTLGPTGNRTAVTELSGRTVNYSYDDLYRLTGESIASDPHGGNGSASYSYDPVGNRLNRSSSIAPVPPQSSTYDANDRLTSDNYDNNGNTTSAGGSSYAYDFENRLTSLNSGSVTYVYDGDGNRVAKTVGGVTTNYLIDNNNSTGYAQVVEELQSGAVVKSFTYGHDLISQRCSTLTVNCSLSFYQYDGHGSVRQLTNASGAITDTYDYDAFGNLIYRSGTTPNDYLYTGEQFDANLGFYYLRARYMNPSSGRFMSSDSFAGNQADPASLHKYLYANSDPVNRVDPDGQFSLANTVITSSIIGAVSGFGLGLLTGGLKGAVSGAVQGAIFGALVPLTGAGVGVALLGNAARGVFIVGWGVGLGSAGVSGYSFATATTGEERFEAGVGLVASVGFMFVGPKVLQYANTRIIAAEEVNAEFLRLRNGQGQPPWTWGTWVTETTIFRSAKYVRVFTEGQTKPVGAWVMEASEIEGLSMSQIQQKFALPFTPTHVTTVNLPAGTTIRTGLAGQNDFGPGGGMQVHIQE